MNKIIFYAFAATIGLVVSSCGKIPIDIKFNIPNETLTIPANPNQAYQVFTYPVSHDSVTAILQSLGGTTDITKVSSAVVKGLNAQITTTGVDFSKIASIEVYMKLATDTMDVGTQVAYSQNLGAGVTQTVLALNGANVTQILTNDMILTVKVLNAASGNSTPISIQLSQGYIDLTVKP